MIRLYAPGVGNGGRIGDATLIEDAENHLVIDGYCGSGTSKLINYLKKRKITKPVLFISHAHYDHYYGIRKIINDKWFSPRALYCYDPESLRAKTVRNNGGYGYVKSEITNLGRIIREAKDRGIPVKYMKHGQSLTFGEIKMLVYRKQPDTLLSDDDQGDAFINDGSLCFWFPELRYWTSGDGPEKIYDMCRAAGAKPVFFKIPHHGNNCPRLQANGMKEQGAKYCWDNDPSKTYTEFLLYGRRRCVEAGIKYFDCIGDLNFISQSGYVSIYKNGGVYRYKCGYRGQTALKGADAGIVRKVIRGNYGSSETRVTNLIDAGYYPAAVQDMVNKVTTAAKGIKSGSLDYGKNEERIQKLDSLLGRGYGQLVQDYINVLCGVRKAV